MYFSRIICNGKVTDPVFLKRGVRQGCPLLPLLHVLVSKVLSTQIRNCHGIVGFRLPGAGGLQFKVSQYADDATNFAKDEKSLCNLLHVVYKYEKGLVPSSIPLTRKQCGLEGGETMVPAPLD